MFILLHGSGHGRGYSEEIAFADSRKAMFKEYCICFYQYFKATVRHCVLHSRFVALTIILYTKYLHWYCNRTHDLPLHNQ